MASAGRILILPKGNYDSSVTYEMLDLVFHGGASWVAKKTVVGIEPTDDNKEHWMKMCESLDLTEILQRIAALEAQMLGTISLDDIDLSGYLEKKGGTLTGDLKINKDNPRIQMKNENNSRHAIFESGTDGYTSVGNWKSSDDQVNLQVRKFSDGLDNLLRITVNGENTYRVFGEHNLDLLKEHIDARIAEKMK